MSQTDYTIIIPARYASSRFPGKMLVPINGRPMIDCVHARAAETGASQVLIATDDERIEAHCIAAGFRVIMTSVSHVSGTDRAAEVAMKLNWNDDAIVVVLQGDEPAMPAAYVDLVAANLDASENASIATLCAPITSRADYLDANRVKVVRDQHNHALYFSRAPIPYRRDESRQADSFPDSFVHIGLYAYRVGFLKRYCELAPHPLEQEEKLEQLRALANGFQIHVDQVAELPAHGVDTPQDVAKIERFLQAGH